MGSRTLLCVDVAGACRSPPRATGEQQNALMFGGGVVFCGVVGWLAASIQAVHGEDGDESVGGGVGSGGGGAEGNEDIGRGGGGGPRGDATGMADASTACEIGTMGWGAWAIKGCCRAVRRRAGLTTGEAATILVSRRVSSELRPTRVWQREHDEMQRR